MGRNEWNGIYVVDLKIEDDSNMDDNGGFWICSVRMSEFPASGTLLLVAGTTAAAGAGAGAAAGRFLFLFLFFFFPAGWGSGGNDSRLWMDGWFRWIIKGVAPRTPHTYTPNYCTYTLNLLVVHPDVLNFISISFACSTTTNATENFQNFTVYEIAYVLLISSKILKIGRESNMIFDVEIEAFLTFGIFDVPNLNFNYGH